jgi:tRNA-binding protein
MSETISWDDFQKVKIKIGTVVRAEEFPEARKPAYKVWVDFGGDLGVKKSSAQITVHYKPEDLIGRQIVAVVNFPPMQIGPIKSEFLLTGFYDEDGAVVIAQPERPVPNGARLV